jgi:hypothetical protein
MKSKNGRLQIEDIYFSERKSISKPYNTISFGSFFKQGYKMDDLLTSYISMMLTNINKGKRGTIHGERLWGWQMFTHLHYQRQNTVKLGHIFKLYENFPW